MNRLEPIHLFVKTVPTLARGGSDVAVHRGRPGRLISEGYRAGIVALVARIADTAEARGAEARRLLSTGKAGTP